eukprot:CAMPEP_0174356608 /NCGR_PEP_ID=MMETSP0811_2-20130205/30894_1 /TAXON_ID=73025 ORGANISM="Eutreptiella gymnastica-like, Strain CCMP1594" /NCGR_SAMPLE_ID=MMETSP0811_2 /ASSEMBLY_ACC=CAM_ASM_000667 /LENGTH=72 /DNA_ID=CAMNT_0015488747 /DNA_START=134 /DNA_END=350 /DNA_ORIENTATION=-
MGLTQRQRRGKALTLPNYPGAQGSVDILLHPEAGGHGASPTMRVPLCPDPCAAERRLLVPEMPVLFDDPTDE